MKQPPSRHDLSSSWIAETEASVSKGRTGALIALAVAKLSGRDPYGGDFERDTDGARALLERARSLGAVTATHLLACTIEVAGGGVAANAAAIELHEEAAQNGSFHSCIALARIYRGDDRQMSSNDLARMWYQRALDTGRDVDDLETLAEAREYIAQAR